LSRSSNSTTVISLSLTFIMICAKGLSLCVSGGLFVTSFTYSICLILLFRVAFIQIIEIEEQFFVSI